MRADLVFEGGGVKGAALAGAAGRLHTRGVQAVHIGGSSAGAVVAALYAAGYRDEDELRDLVTSTPFPRFRDRDLLDHVPVVGPLASLVLDQGVYEGDALEGWVRSKLAARHVRTFGDLRAAETHPRGFAHTCEIVVADVTDRQLLVLPHDAPRLGLDPDELDVALVVRASAAIPFFFEPVVLADGDGADHVLVDGGLLSNFPVWLFDVAGPPRWPTLGVNLVDADCRCSPMDRLPEEPGGRHGLVDHVRAVVGTLIEARDKLALEQADAVRTIDVPNLGVATTDFDLTPEEALALFDSGAAAVDVFLAGWDTERYVAAHRVA